jgi:hypothetical protein
MRRQSGRKHKGKDRTMQVLRNGYRGLSLLVGLNRDRVFVLGTVTVGLLAGGFPGSALVRH